MTLETIGMTIDTLIEHKEAIVVCEENGLISLNYNVLLTTPKTNIIANPTILVVITKSSLTCTDCGKHVIPLSYVITKKKKYQ
jgi:hypothetical protein